MGDRADFPIVGIGASAGGLEALQELVGAIPKKTGLCFVVVQHLAPNYPSIMDQLLGNRSAVPVRKIEDGMRPEPDCVFVLPAGPSVTLEKGRFRLHERSAEQGVRTPIDEFFASLSEAKGRDAFCIVLSGTGSDGTNGLRAIKAAGGCAIAQQHESARFPGMPDSAAATGMVDFVLKPKQMPDKILDIVQHRDELENAHSDEAIGDQIEQNLSAFIKVLNDEGGYNFAEYKSGTLIRRIKRRMALLRKPTAEEFLDLLKEDEDERARLQQDFLIGVTEFFRDPEAFEQLLQQAIEPLLDRDVSKFRIWVPACSTGEEAYTIAMLFKEALDRRDDQRNFQVFGTDIDAAALSHARAGFYPESSVSDIGPKRLETFFVRSDNRFQVSPFLRECCVFAPHNLLEDPPFSRLDLVSCRNLMIYLTSEVQEKIISRFHYALNDSSFLLLGPSESLGKADSFFRTVDRDVRLFQRNDEKSSGYSTLTDYDYSQLRRSRTSVTSSPLGEAEAEAEPDIESQITSFFLRQRAAPFAVINRQDEVVYVSERMGTFLKPAMGLLSPALDQFLTRELRLPVRSAVSEARETSGLSIARNIVVSEEGSFRLVDVYAEPLPSSPGNVLVTLEPVRSQDTQAIVQNAGRSASENELVDRELALTKKRLRKTEAEYRSAEQELKSSNEELLSMNEELQSSNEELETSREELQSINEELETINAELSENNRQLLEANSDLKNLFESTEIATVFLDQNLCVRRYTPALRKLFGIQDRDIGRSINDLAWKVSYDNLEQDADRVSETLQPIEREVVIEQTDETFLMRIRPYRRTDDRIDGCVVTFFDITTRKRFERQITESADLLARQYAELETLYDTTPVGLSLLDRDLRYIRINARLAAINGFAVEDHIGKKQEEMLFEIDSKIADTQREVLRTGEPSLANEVRGTTPAEPGRERVWMVDYYPVRKDGEVFAVGSCVQEITDQVEARKKLAEKEARLGDALRVGKIGVHDYDPRTGHVEWTERVHEIFGTPHDQPVTYETFAAGVHPDDLPRVEARLSEALEADGDGHFVADYRVINARTGEMRWVRADGDATFENGEATRLVGTVIDITEQVQAKEQQELLLNELQHRVKNTLATTLAIVQFSALRAQDVPSFTRTLRSRLQALSRTHDLLTAREWLSGSLRQVIMQELSAYGLDDRDRVLFEGTDAQLTPKQMLSLALAFHELATNAAKYGALSTDEGKVRIVAEERDGMIAVEWRETGGPAVKAPDANNTGFGSFLIQRVLSADLDGQVKTAYEPEGFVCQVAFPAKLSRSREV